MIGSINSNKDYGARASIDTHAGTINAHGMTFQITIPTTDWISFSCSGPDISISGERSSTPPNISSKRSLAGTSASKRPLPASLCNS